MRCPVDETTLQMTERQGVEIDYCPECRGVWLDRGELDKIIDRTPGEAAPAAPVRDERRHYEDRPAPQTDYRSDGRTQKKKRKESFLGDLFDF